MILLAVEDLKITCPECGETGDLPVYESVNVTREPDLKNAVLDAGLFTWTCPLCGKTVRVSYPFLYHDMKRRLMIHFEPDGAQNSQELAYMTAASGLFRGTDYKLRTVQNYEQLLEKICIFDQELDDRVVELCKAVLIRELAQEHPELSIRRALIDVRDDRIYVAFIDIDEDVFAIELPDDLYNRLYDLAYDLIADTDTDTFQTVDTAWATRTLSAFSL